MLGVLAPLLMFGLPTHAEVPVQLDPLYFEGCRRPCEYVGFSFSEDSAAMREMREHGANAVGSGSMWIPTDDPTAPDGLGIGDLAGLRDVLHLGQSFTVGKPITGVALCTPTFSTQGGGCTLSLYARPPDQWQGEALEPLATVTLTDVKDNQQSWLTFAELPAGSYYLEQSAPTGPAIGVWALGRDAYGSGQAYIGRRPVADDLELRCRTAGGEEVLVASEESHHALRLGQGMPGQIADQGLAFDYAVGNWNNGGFPYYPKWFIERFPEHAMLDQNGQSIMCGMFGELAPWPNIDNALIVDGTERYIRAVVGALKDNPKLLYWTMGGEALYATYLMPGRWTDYSEDAIAHYRAWLKLQGRTDVAEAEPPRQPGHDLATLDWFRFRNVAMGERFQYHFAATKAADPSRLVVTCNHGDLFSGMSGTRLGEDLALFAGVSDGWEMGQIVSDDDPDLYNLMWMRSAGAFGKPLCPVRLAYRKSNPRARGGGTSFTPESARRYFWESVGTGAWHMGFIQWSGSLPDGEWGVKGTPAQREIGDILREWHAIEGYFDDAWPVKAPVGLYFSQLTWTLDGFQPVWTRLCRELTQRQIGYRILSDDHLRWGDLEGLSLIVSAENPVMARESAESLRRFADAGGQVVLIGRNAEEDERLKPLRLPRPTKAVHRKSDPLDVFLLEMGIRRANARLLGVWAKADGSYLARVAEATSRQHDTPFDLAGHESVGQTFTAHKAGLRSVSVSNPTYTKTVTAHQLTLELREGGPGGRVLASRTYVAEDLTDNAWHAVELEAPAPAGAYYLRLLTPPSLPPQTLGTWGTRDDSYPGGTLYLDDEPAGGDLRVELAFDVERPAKAALEAFPLSDGTNAIVILTNITGVRIEARVEVSPALLPEREYVVRDLATGTELGKVQGGSAHVTVTIPPNRSAVLLFGAADPGPVEARLREAEAAIAKLPTEATGPQRAHLDRARDALAAGRPEKALACLRRATEREPLALSADVRDGQLAIRAETFSDEGKGDLKARFVPCPGVQVPLRRQPGGVYAVSMPLGRLPFRYDYRRREYLPYWGALEVVVTGRVGGRVAAGSCVVEVPKS
ncbi:MAG: hypothetical protein FJX75_07760 [Armatimonadetes bacterium]|nr:hypothetical protein [Armatimonadota bacterium]